MVGYPRRSICGSRPEAQNRTAGDLDLLKTLTSGGFPSGVMVTLRYVHRNGSIVWAEQRKTLITDPEGRLIAIEGIARDITERKLL